MHQVRGKLFVLSEQNSWKERGTGTLKLNVRKSDGAGARLGTSLHLSARSTILIFVVVMRKEAVYSLLLNVTLFHGMACSLAQDPRYVRFSVFESGIPTHYNLRVRCLPILHCLVLTYRYRLRIRRLQKSCWKRSRTIYLRTILLIVYSLSLCSLHIFIFIRWQLPLFCLAVAICTYHIAAFVTTA